MKLLGVVLFVILVHHTFAQDSRNKSDSTKNVDDVSGFWRNELKRSILADQSHVLKQKFILDVLMNSTKTWSKEELTQNNKDIIDGENNYSNFHQVAHFISTVKNKTVLLPRNHIYTIANKDQRQQTADLFNLFYYSKDFNIFQQNVLWAVSSVHKDMFVLALYATVAHRNDLKGIKLPALYEIIPEKFHNIMTIKNILDIVNSRKFAENENFAVLNKYTSDYAIMNDESKLAYLTEDIGWNFYHFSFNMDFPSWLGGKDLNLNCLRRGERYLHFLQQIVARYNLERYSNGLGKIKDIAFIDRVETGYNPLLRYSTGVPVSARRNFYDIFTNGDYRLVQRVLDVERRIRDGIDQGFLMSLDGSRVELNRSDAINVLGNVIQSNVDSINTKFYDGLVRNLAILLGGGQENDHEKVPSVLEHYETALRDPVIYQLYKRVLKLFYQFKDTLPVYRKEDLFLEGIRVTDVRTTKLMTYFDLFDVDVSNLIPTTADSFKSKEDHKLIVARHVRLNHKPFTVDIDIVADRPQKSVVRIFIGHKTEEKTLHFQDFRDDFVEVDRFLINLQSGRVTLRRSSRDFTFTAADRSTIFDIYKSVLSGQNIDYTVDMLVNEAHYKFPDRLLLPKGSSAGVPMQIFVIITKAKDAIKRDDSVNIIHGELDILNGADDVAMGFPFDRHIDENEFFTPNMLFRDIAIFHNREHAFI